MGINDNASAFRSVKPKIVIVLVRYSVKLYEVDTRKETVKHCCMKPHHLVNL